jgi:dTDP-4-dehydrorhamnose reductase
LAGVGERARRRAAVSRRVLLIGGAGRLGTAIRATWSGDTIDAPPRAQLDLEREDGVATAIDRFSPGVVVNCAAFHDVDACERFVERAFAVNAVAVERAARACRDRGVAFVTVSTDYVFDGSTQRPYAEDDPPHPLSVYGTSKLAGELLVERLGMRALVIRTCGVYGQSRRARPEPSFAERILARARDGESIAVVSDVIASPTYAEHLAQAIRALLDAEAWGLFHAAGFGPVSWYDFACELLAQAGIDFPVQPIAAHEWKSGARRPRFSALDDRKLRGAGFTMPSWKDGVAAYVRRLPGFCA